MQEIKGNTDENARKMPGSKDEGAGPTDTFFFERSAKKTDCKTGNSGVYYLFSQSLIPIHHTHITFFFLNSGAFP